jgi:transcription elongation factor GreB
MSKAFTKDDAREAPLVLPRRAPLPDDVPNYVTSRGLALLHEELANERRRLAGGNVTPEQHALHVARLAAIEQRIASAVLVDSRAQPKERVRFGATVEVQSSSGARRRYHIVGVDEADAARGSIAFVAPLARSLLGKAVGDVATVTTPAGEDELEILAIAYE